MAAPLKTDGEITGFIGVDNPDCIEYISTLEQLEQDIPSSLGVIFADINGLKRTNDVHGHRYGDSLIAHYASLIQHIAPKEDIFRIGGDEFVILLRDISQKALSLKVTELNKNILEYFSMIE